MDTFELAATVIAGTALVLAPIDPQPIRDLNTPIPDPTPEPVVYDQDLSAKVRTALGMPRFGPARDDNESETRLCMWDQADLNTVYERVGGTVTARTVERSVLHGSTWQATEITVTVDLPGIGHVEVFTDWYEETGGRELPLMQAIPDATLIAS